MMAKRRREPNSRALRWLSRMGRQGAALAARAARRLAVFVFDAAFLAYFFTMGSYVVTRIATGEGEYITIPGGFIVLAAIAGAALWGALGTTVGEKLLQFLRGPRGSAPKGKGHARSGPPQPAAVPQRVRWVRTLWGWSLALALALTLVAATVVTKVDFSRLRQGFPAAMKIVARLVNPEWSILGDVIRDTIITLFMGLMATLLAIPVAAILSFLAARNLAQGPTGRFVYNLVRALISITRAIEPMIWAIVFAIWVRMGPFAGTLALFVCSIADLTKLYSEQLESIDMGPAEAITAVGGRRSQVLVHGIVPQIINPYLSFTFYRWDINVRMATIIGMVGGGGIGQQLFQYAKNGTTWRETGTCILAIIVVVWALDMMSARTRARLA